MNTTATTDRAYEALAELRARLPELRHAIVRGTARRWHQVEINAGRRERMDQLVREERAERAGLAARGIKVMGEGRTPIDLGVLDAEREILRGIAVLEYEVCERLGLTPNGATASATITRIVGLLRRIERDTELAEHIDAEAHRLNRMAARALGEAEPVTRLTIRCPTCDTLSMRVLVERDLVVCVATCRQRWPMAQWAELEVAA